MKLAIGGIMHESNTFCSMPTDRAAFEAGGLSFGDEIRQKWAESHHEVGGFYEGAERFGYEVVPTVMAWAMPSGPVADAMLDEITDRIVSGIRETGEVDGLLYAPHGAMVAESYPDGDGEMLRRLREALGPDFPLVNTFDFHGNGSEQQVAQSTTILYYQTNPHVDQRQRGLVAAELMTRVVRGEVRPTMAIAKPPLIVPIVHQDTSKEPLRTLLAEARERERASGVLAVNVVAGFPYADVPNMGPSIVVVTDDDPALARRIADEMGERLWSVRDQLVVDLPSPKKAVSEAIRCPERPVVLVDFGDNVGGGSPADSTFLFRELLDQGAEDSVVVIADPECVRLCDEAGEGSPVQLSVGGKTDTMHGTPVEVEGTVRTLHDGTWIEDQPRHGGKRYNDQGRTALVELNRGNLLVLTTRRYPPFSLGQLTSVGIEPAKQKILVVKAAIAYKAAYLPIATRIIEVDTPGVTAVNPAHFEYRHIRRPMFPLDR